MVLFYFSSFVRERSLFMATRGAVESRGGKNLSASTLRGGQNLSACSLRGGQNLSATPSKNTLYLYIFSKILPLARHTYFYYTESNLSDTESNLSDSMLTSLDSHISGCKETDGNL